MHLKPCVPRRALAALFAAAAAIGLMTLSVAAQAVWTPSANAPAGMMTALAAQHHDRFIARSRAGSIDLVFFGTTDTEMWNWPERGRPVWDQAFGSRKAANFG